MEDMFKGKGLIFVGGAPRSGTTLVQRILNAHPDIYGGPEFDLIPNIIRLKTIFDKKITTGRIDAFLENNDVSKLFSGFIKQALFIKKEKEGVKYLSEKTPSNILVFNELIDLLPEAKYIFVVRDPRAIICSLLEVGKRYKLKRPDFTSDVVSAVRFVNKCLNTGCRALEKHPPTILIKYERLLLDKSNEIKELFKKLGLDEYRVDLKKSNFVYSNDTESWKNWYTKDQLQSDIYTSAIDIWKQRLKPYQIDYIEKKIEDNLIRQIYFEGKQLSHDKNFRAEIEHYFNTITQKVLDLSGKAFSTNKTTKRGQKKLRTQ